MAVVAADRSFTGRTSPLYSIVSRFPGVVECRDRFIGDGRLDKFLMIVGGTITERDACIDYISGPSSVRLDNGHLCDTGRGTVVRDFFDLKKSGGSCEDVLQKVESVCLKGRRRDDRKLLVIHDVANISGDVWSRLEQKFCDGACRPDLVIGTSRDKGVWNGLPDAWRRMFREVVIPDTNTTAKTKGIRSGFDFGLRDEVDRILMQFHKKHPANGREFVVKRALPAIRKILAGHQVYAESTLMTRLSVVRQQMGELRG